MSGNMLLFQEDSREDKNHEIFCLINDIDHKERIRLHKFMLPDNVRDIQDKAALVESDHEIDPNDGQDREEILRRRKFKRSATSFFL